MRAWMGPLRWLARLWFGWSKRVGRREYALSALALMVGKYGIDAAVIHSVTGESWTPMGYLSDHLEMDFAPAIGGLTLPALWVWSLPFVWIGASLSLRRAAHAGLPASVGLLFFVPFANYLCMLALCLLPSAERVGASARVPDSRESAPLGDITSAAAQAALLGTALMLLSAIMLRTYGAALFLGAPFAMGFMAAHRLRGRRSFIRTVAATQLSVLMMGAH